VENVTLRRFADDAHIKALARRAASRPIFAEADDRQRFACEFSVVLAPPNDELFFHVCSIQNHERNTTWT